MRYWILQHHGKTICKATCPEGSDAVYNLIAVGYIEVTEQEYNNTEVTQTEAPPTTLRELQAENKLLKAQLQAQTDRADFIEDCIAEMATVVYGGV